MPRANPPGLFTYSLDATTPKEYPAHMPDVAEPPIQHKTGRFTAETARKAALASVAARKAKAERALTPAVEPLKAPAPTVEDYTRLRLACVREQLALVDKAILRESFKDHPDGQRLNWLASAQERLAEQERILAGRPLPGSRKPAPERRQSAYDAALAPVPVAPDPAPVNPPPASTATPDSSSMQGKESISPQP